MMGDVEEEVAILIKSCVDGEVFEVVFEVVLNFSNCVKKLKV